MEPQATITMQCAFCFRVVEVPLHPERDIERVFCENCSRTGELMRISTDGRFLDRTPF